MKNDLLLKQSLAAGFFLASVSMYPVTSFALTANENKISVVGVDQQKDVVTVKGIVTESETGEPLIGASVRVKDTGKGIITDLEGRFSIEVPSDATLVISYLGMKTVEYKVPKNGNLNVALQSNANMLDEVVAIGYGTMKRSDLTGSVVSISSDVIEKSGATTIDQVLQGHAAGVQMTMNSGIPGAGASVSIRGINSINNSNEPIYVVDGVIISGETGDNTSNALAGINPSDVESIEVLKDASATAIYGAQAANGVILITMKKGSAAKPRVSFQASYGVQELPEEIDMMNLREYALHYNAVQRASGYDDNQKPQFSNPETLGTGTNWQRAIFSDAPIQKYDLAIRGGNKDSNYSLSAGYLDQDGIATGTSFERMTIRLSAEINAYKWLKLGSSINLSHTDQNTSMATWSLIPNALYQSPQVPVYNLDGSYGAPDDTNDANFSNPLAVAELTDRVNEKAGARGNIFALVTFMKGLTFRTEFTADGNIDNYRYFLPEYEIGYSTNANTQNEHSKRYSLYWGWKNVVNFEHTFDKKHRLTVMLGHEMTSNKSDYLQGKRLDGSSELTGLDAGDANTASNIGNGSETNFLSFFGRLFYSYDNRYQFTATIRHDGTSRFASGNQWGTFPSAAVAWRVSEEKWFKPLKDVINNLKFRASYGITGNSNVSAFAYTSLLTNNQSNFGTALQTGNIPNEDLTWESTKAWNVGMDLNLFNNRIEFIVDLYRKRTDDLLLQLTLPGYVGTNGQGGASAPWANIGSMENKGVEFTLNTVNINTKNFQWRTGITFSLNRNKILEMNSETGYIDKTYQIDNISGTVTRTQEGHPISQFYGFNVIGRVNSAADFLKDNGDGTSTVIKATKSYRVGTVIDNNATNLMSSTYIGDLLYEDVNNDGIINDSDRTFIGNPLPDFTFGFNNTFNYKNFDLSISTYGSIGGEAYNLLRVRLDNPNGTSNKRSATANYCRIGYLDGNSENTNIWNLYVLPGAAGDQVRMGGVNDPEKNSDYSSRFVEDASYFRIQNITLGWTLPDSWVKKLRINRLRIYASVQNVCTFTGYKGYDPEIGATQAQYSYSGQSMLMYGVDTGRIPAPRTYNFGIDLTF